MTQDISERDTKDAVLEAQERLNESRRGFFKMMGLGAAAASGVGAARCTAARRWPTGDRMPPAFALDPSATYMNIGTTGSTPTAVLKNLAANNALIARDPTQSFNTQQMRDSIAPGFGALPFEIAISYNTTDGMSLIFNGIAVRPRRRDHHDQHGAPRRELAPADHGGSDRARGQADRPPHQRCATAMPWCWRGSRPCSPEHQGHHLLVAAVTLPASACPEKLLCQWAAAAGLMSIIDGAHGTGMLNLNFHDMGCDFYAGSGHKWQCGPGRRHPVRAQQHARAPAVHQDRHDGGVGAR